MAIGLLPEDVHFDGPGSQDFSFANTATKNSLSDLDGSRGLGQPLRHAPVESPAFDVTVQGYASDVQPTSAGSDLMAEVVVLLHRSRIQCCFASEAALIYYGAHRTMLDWIICVEDDKLEMAATILEAAQHVVQPFCASAMKPSGTIDHHFPRFKFSGYRCFFHIVPAWTHRMPLSPDSIELSRKGLPFPKLGVFAQSLLETMNRVDLVDLVDAMNLTYEWGLEHLDLDGRTDTTWAERRLQFHEQHDEWPPTFLRKDGKPKSDLWLRMASPEAKLKRRGHKALPRDETRFRWVGQKDPRDLHMW